MKSLLALVTLLAVCALSNGTYRYVLETRLRDNLFKDYHNDVIPVADKAVKVDFGMALIMINSVDTRRGLADLSTWLRMTWNDARLRWDPEQYEGVKMIRVSPKYVWLPDLTVYNSPTVTTRLSTLSQSSVLIYNDGKVMYIPPARVEARGFEHGPHFNISMKIGSWVYDGYKLDLGYYEDQQSVDLADYYQARRWNVLGTSVQRHEKYYPCCPEPYPDIGVNITLIRKG